MEKAWQRASCGCSREGEHRASCGCQMRCGCAVVANTGGPGGVGKSAVVALWLFKGGRTSCKLWLPNGMWLRCGCKNGGPRWCGQARCDCKGKVGSRCFGNTEGARCGCCGGGSGAPCGWSKGGAGRARCGHKRRGAHSGRKSTACVLWLQKGRGARAVVAKGVAACVLWL